MEQDVREVIAKLEERITNLERQLAAGLSGSPKKQGAKIGHIEKMPDMCEDPALQELLDKAENKCGRENLCGCITYLGVFSSGNRQSTWASWEREVDPLLELVQDQTAQEVLACIGNSDRLNMMLALLDRPMTVVQLVEKCGYSSTGQVYYHLKPLLALHIVIEEKEMGKGYFAIAPDKVQGIVMLLAGLGDLAGTNKWEKD